MKTWSQKPGREALAAISCGLCGHDTSLPHWDCEGFSFVRCKSCGVIFQNPQPVQSQLLERYNDEYFAYEIKNEKQFFNLMLQGLKDAHLDALPESTALRPRFLDIGCATGMLLAHQKSLGWEVQGVEVCRPAALWGSRERDVPIFAGTLQEARFADQSFDVIHLSHLIEHLNDPLAFLAEVYRILAPGGRALITTPNTEGFQTWLFQERWRSAIADHLYLFGKTQLRQAIQRAGFVPGRFVTWGGLAKGSAPRWLKYIADKLAKPLGLGDVMLLTAYKK